MRPHTSVLDQGCFCVVANVTGSSQQRIKHFVVTSKNSFSYIYGGYFMHPRQLYLTQSGNKTTLKWYEVSLYFADCMHCCFQIYKL